MAKPRSTFTTRAKESLKEQSQNFAVSEAKASARGDTAAAERFAVRRERVERALNGVFAREQRPKKRKRRGGGSSAGS